MLAYASNKYTALCPPLPLTRATSAGACPYVAASVAEVPVPKLPDPYGRQAGPARFKNNAWDCFTINGWILSYPTLQRRDAKPPPRLCPSPWAGGQVLRINPPCKQGRGLLLHVRSS